ncbi:MAG: hypothetical protein HY907_07655 [Deltaproteobacteria bacterium]|nr:hypothetical protein [Deltaproteobacteria bacterium]
MPPDARRRNGDPATRDARQMSGEAAAGPGSSGTRDQAPQDARPAPLRRAAPLLGLLAVVAAHVGLALYFDPPAVILSTRPLPGFDWETHYGQVHAAAEAYGQSGRTWAYNPQQLAGQISGVIFDADNKAWEAWTIGLESLGVPRPIAFNLFLWLAAFLVPLVFYASARLFDVRPWTAVAAAALGSACWFFDALAHWCAWVGMICWGFAAYLWLLPLAAFWRWRATRDPWWLLAVLALLSLLLNLHPYSFFLLAPPMAVLYLRDVRTLGWREHLGVAAVAVGAVVANLWWLRPTLRFWSYILDSGFYLDATVDYVLTDWLGLLNEPSVSGVVAVRSGFRFLALGGAALGLWWWRRERDRRFAPFAAALGVLLFVSYFGGYLGFLRQVQPYRFILPAMYLAVIPAAVFLERGIGALRAARPPAAAWGLVGLLLFVTVPRLARDVLYFVPELLPQQTRPLPAPPPDVNGGIYFGTIRWPAPFDFRHRPGTAEDLPAMAAFVDAHDDGSGRWLVEWWMLGEHLAWATKAQVIGGFKEINLAHSDANLFRRFPGTEMPGPEQLRQYLQQYAVKWVVISNPIPALESRTDLLRLENVVFRHRIYRVREPSRLLVGDGPGEVRAGLNRIAVRGSPGGSLVLRYHWLETLRCRPGCRLRRVPVPNDRVGFIGVEDAPHDFEIFNAY